VQDRDHDYFLLRVHEIDNIREPSHKGSANLTVHASVGKRILNDAVKASA
jgi:hypothetical protein